jgi:4-hydroxyacetophenone monooxygenase
VTYHWQIGLMDVDDAQLRAALDQAHIPALLATIVHFTGNTDHFAQVQPRFELLAEDPDGLTEDERSLARELAFAALSDYRKGAGLVELSDAAIQATMHRITGEDIPDLQLPMLREELNLFGEDTRRLKINTQSMDPDFQVLIIGSGMSGIVAAIRLQQEGIPFLMVPGLKTRIRAARWILPTTSTTISLSKIRSGRTIFQGGVIYSNILTRWLRSMACASTYA